MKNFLTIDVEEWFHAELPKRQLTNNTILSSNIENEIDLFIDICEKNDIKSTCFIVGKLALEKPILVQKLFNAGHEIASHSYLHRLCYELTPKEFKSDTIKSIDILENITGNKVEGYRAPSWSVNKAISPWFYSILEECGLSYSSSVFPGKTFLYGYPEFGSKIRKAENTSLYEIPQQLLKLGPSIGVSGGFYLRFFPKLFVSLFLTKYKSNTPKFIYVHPWELIKSTKGLKLNMIDNFITNYGIKNNAKKLSYLAFRSDFQRMDNYIKNLNQSNIKEMENNY